MSRATTKAPWQLSMRWSAKRSSLSDPMTSAWRRPRSSHSTPPVASPLDLTASRRFFSPAPPGRAGGGHPARTGRAPSTPHPAGALHVSLFMHIRNAVEPGSTRAILGLYQHQKLFRITQISRHADPRKRLPNPVYCHFHQIL